MKTNPRLTPLLAVRGAERAVEFYIHALGAREIVRYVNKEQDPLSHADLAVGDAIFSVTEEARAWNSDAPPSLGGSPVVLQLRVDHADALFESMCRAGATVVFPLQTFCGERMARVRDPFGHLWILIERIEDLSHEEIQKRRDALFAQLAVMRPSSLAEPHASPRTTKEAETIQPDAPPGKD
jgi:PhnB protein